MRFYSCRYGIFLASWITALSWQRDWHKSMKLWVMPCRVIQDGWVMLESSDKIWSTGGPWQTTPVYYSENAMNSIKRQNDMTPKHEFPRTEGVQQATGEEGAQGQGHWPWRKNEVTRLKHKHCLVMHMYGGDNNVQYCNWQLHRNLEC